MKAIIVIDVPEKCKNCDLYREDKYADYICMATLEYVNGNEKPINCPLKPMPKKIDKVDYFESRGIDYDFGLSKEIDGYNRCVDEITGGE